MGFECTADSFVEEHTTASNQGRTVSKTVSKTVLPFIKTETEYTS